MTGKLNNIYVVIPYFNESTVIARVVEPLLQGGYNIVIIDDGSSQRPESSLSANTQIAILHHRVNLGQGAALQTGIEFALKQNAEYIITFDGDGQHDATDIPTLLNPLLNENIDITLASRFLKKGSHNAPAGRSAVLKFSRWINYLFTGLYLSDSHNGLRAMTRSAAQQFDLKENRMAHATEVLLAIKKKKLKYREVPATVIYTEYSKKKGQSIFNSIKIFFDLVLHKLFE
jgi:glycosyltransferase involved in cell wall biosynthesis